MATQSEKGHAKNLANLKLLKDIILQAGQNYSPSNELLTYTLVDTLINRCSVDYDNWADKLIQFKYRSDEREIVFEKIDKLATSINASVQQLNVPQQTLNDIQAFVTKIHGTKAKIKKLPKNAPTTTATTVPELPVDPISTSQLSYDSIASNFELLVKRLQTIPAYAPNESELQMQNLLATVDLLRSLNLAAGSAANSLSLARNQRNLSFYAPQTGLYDVAKKIKNYLRSNPATANSAYKDAVKLNFVKIVQRKKKKA